jgi:hypothetical protein
MAEPSSWRLASQSCTTTSGRSYSANSFGERYRVQPTGWADVCALSGSAQRHHLLHFDGKPRRRNIGWSSRPEPPGLDDSVAVCRGYRGNLLARGFFMPIRMKRHGVELAQWRRLVRRALGSNRFALVRRGAAVGRRQFNRSAGPACGFVHRGTDGWRFHGHRGCHRCPARCNAACSGCVRWKPERSRRGYHWRSRRAGVYPRRFRPCCSTWATRQRPLPVQLLICVPPDGVRRLAGRSQPPVKLYRGRRDHQPPWPAYKQQFRTAPLKRCPR